MEKEFKERINLNTNLSNISKEICKRYNLGDYLSETIILVGYEDFNYILETTIGKYCVKIFNKERTDKDCRNYVDRIELASNLNINTPKLYKYKNNGECDIVIENVKYRLCVFDYIDGESFFDLGITPNYDEIKEIIRQMANIHTATLKSDFIYDKWAIINFKKEMQDKGRYLQSDDKKKLEALLNKFLAIDMSKLPSAFVHGDIISTNVMKDTHNKLYIIDFAVSNYLPRIIDLAVSACNLCLEANDKEMTINKIKMVIEEYEKYNKLTDYEIEQFPIFFDVANAMCILQISYLASLGEMTEEDKFWYEESKQGLEFSNKSFWVEVFNNKKLI